VGRAARGPKLVKYGSAGGFTRRGSYMYLDPAKGHPSMTEAHHAYIHRAAKPVTPTLNRTQGPND